VGAPIANVSKHLHVLYNAELVARRREGTRVLYRLAQQAVWEICVDMEAVACAAMVSPVDDAMTSHPVEATADFGPRSRILRR